MITRIYFLSATQVRPGGVVHNSWRTVMYKSWFPTDHRKILDSFFETISLENSLPKDKWTLVSFNRIQ